MLLLKHNNSEIYTRQVKGLRDVSQNNNWSNFRNATFNGVPLVLDDTFWQCNATMGTLEVRARVGLYSNLEEHVHITRVSMLMPNAPSFPSSTT